MRRARFSIIDVLAATLIAGLIAHNYLVGAAIVVMVYFVLVAW